MWVKILTPRPEPAFISVLEVLAANGVDAHCAGKQWLHSDTRHFPMPFWFTIKGGPLADGIVITPSHNPEDGGIKYNPPNGGPADTNVTKAVEDRANALLADGLKGVKRISSTKRWHPVSERAGSGAAVCGRAGRYR
ncbi:hypothetical protein DMH88_02020 [Escherichia coli]|nr:hypothetical protein [Escherichia coli]